jgi:hypothetical protein
MENKTFMMPPIAVPKFILRSTGEEVEVIEFNLPNRGMRTEAKNLTFEEGDWVTYIDSQGKEHIREHLNIQLDFKTVSNDTFNKLLDAAKSSNIPSTKNQRVFEVAKELVVHGSHVSSAISIAKELVDSIGIEYQ